jgi:probable HAF family extracellular repeat protein
MQARSWFLGVVVVLSSLLLSSRHASGQDARPGVLPRYRVDVVEYTFFGGYGYDINDQGQVALPSAPAAGPSGVTAARWDPQSGMLPVAPSPSLATGINKQGDVTVIDMRDDTHMRSSLWTQREGLTDLGTIGRQTWADDVNDHGVVVGWTERDTDARERYAFQWTREGLQTLPNLPGGSHEGGNAFDVTNKGLIVGYSYGASGQEAVRWVDGKVQGLGDFAGGIHESAAFAANERGQIVGVGHVDGTDVNGDGKPDPMSRAFLWSEDKGMIDLGALGEDHNSVAYDINDDGMVIGYSVKRPGGTSLAFTPFVWTEETGMVDVHTLLDDDSKQWRLGAFQSGRINESGQLLMQGAIGDRYAVVVLTPVHNAVQNPEPGGMLMMAGVAAVLGLRRARRPCVEAS